MSTRHRRLVIELTSAIANTLSTAPTSLSCETGLGTESLTALNTNEDMSDNRK